MKSTPIKILVDNCVDGLSQTMQCVSNEQEISWGDIRQRIKIIGYKRKPNLSSDQEWKIRQIECLPTIARLAREGQVSFYTYIEICFESWKRCGGSPSLGDLFHGIKFLKVPPAIERSKFFQADLYDYSRREAIIEFCKWLHQPGIEALAEKPAIKQRLSEFEIVNLGQVERFRGLCQGLSKKQFPDALHLWTGEVNSLDYFLTTDGKFIRAMTETKKTPLLCRPISPETFLEELGIADFDPLPYQPGKFYNILGIPES